jgi:hypothetical protein
MAKKETPKKEAAAATINQDAGFGSKESHLWILTIAALVGFYFYSTKSVGYYQDDEIAHFMSMLGFWDDPTSVMGNWAKPGYKLLYVLPALLGYKFVVLFNCAISALGCWLAAKTAQHFNKQAAVLAFVLAALQPVWIEISFRNYADILSGVMLIGAVYLALKEKWLFSSLLLSYDVLIRQELIPLALIMGLYLIIKRKWAPMIALGVFPLLYALWTLSAKGDFWYMITEAAATSAAYAKEYPKQGLEHYMLMSAVVFGAIQIALLAVATYQILKAAVSKGWLKSKDSEVLFVFIPFAFFFIIHCIFNLKSPEIGPATGGNLRYMTAITPLVAALGALSLLWLKRPSLSELGVVLGAVAVFVLIFMTYEHSYLKFTIDPKTEDKIKDFFPFVFVLAGAALYFIPLKGLALTGVVAGLGLLYASKEVHPYKLSEENVSVRQLVQRINKQGDLKDRPLYCNHSNIWFYWLTETNTRKEKTGTLDSASIMAAPVGSLMVWDSHYGYRPNRTPGSVMPEYFEQNGYKFLEPLMVTAKDRSFQIAVFEKVK